MKRLLVAFVLIGLASCADLPTSHTGRVGAQLPISQWPIPSSGSPNFSTGDAGVFTRDGVSYKLTNGQGGNCGTNLFTNGITAQGVPVCTQPNFSNIGGSVSPSQLPAIPLGSTATDPNPQRNGESETGLFSDASGFVAVSSQGQKRIDFGFVNNGVDINLYGQHQFQLVTLDNQNSIEMDDVTQNFAIMWYFDESGVSCLGYNTCGPLDAGPNTILGSGVGQTLVSGTHDILLGMDNAVDTPASSTSDFLNIGNTIFATGMTGTGPGSPAGNVGINTDSPEDTPLTVHGLPSSSPGTGGNYVCADSDGGFYVKATCP